MEWRRALGPDRPSFLRRLRHQVAKRAPGLTALGGPIQSVLLARIAAERRREQTRGFAIVSRVPRSGAGPSRRRGRSRSPPARCARSGARALLPCRRRYRIASSCRSSRAGRETASSRCRRSASCALVPRSCRRQPSAMATVNTSRFRRAVAGSAEANSSSPSAPKIACSSSDGRRAGRRRQRAQRLAPASRRFAATPAARRRTRRFDDERHAQQRHGEHGLTRHRRLPPPPPFSSASCFGCSSHGCSPRAPTFRPSSPRTRPISCRSAPGRRGGRAPGADCGRGTRTSSPLRGRRRRRGPLARPPRSGCVPARRSLLRVARCLLGSSSTRSPVALRSARCADSVRLVRSSWALLGAIAPFVREILAMVLPVLARVLAVVVIVVPRVVVHVAAAAPPVRAVVVVVVDGRADRDARGETDHSRDGRIRAGALLDDHRRRRCLHVDHLRVVLRHVDDLRVRRLDDDHLLPGRRGLAFHFLLRRGLERCRPCGPALAAAGCSRTPRFDPP